MYELKQNLEQPLKEGFGEDSKEKRRCSINLFESQWEELDRLSEENNVSRNEVLRRILKIILGQELNFDLFFQSGKAKKDGRS
ncbi:MAG: hypothetical protein ABEJ83_03460 [Candidatus Nanohaloarchaea archaeon]